MSGNQPLLAQTTKPDYHKCNTPEIVDLWRKHGANAKLKHPVVFKRPREADQNSYQSPSGKFLFWYTLEGQNAIPSTDDSGSGIPDWVEKAAEAADQSWDYFIDELGFKDPIEDGSSYEFFFVNLGFYGQTSITDNEPFSIIDATFDWVPGNDAEDDATGALQVTIAHEFYHAIQFAYNEWNGPSGETAWLEMDAVTAENLVFPDVNEYLNFIDQNSIFQIPSNSSPVAYDHTTWMMYFTERFDPAFFQTIWQHIEQSPMLTFPEAIASELDARGTSYHTEMTRLYLWHLSSGNWHHPDYGFQQASRYPTSFKRTQRTSIPNEPYPMWSISKLAANFHAILPSSSDTGEIVVAFFANNPESGFGLLFYLKDGTVEERLLPPAKNGRVFYRSGMMWEDVDRVGIAVSNTGTNQNRLYQMLVGADDGIEQIRYGDVEKNGVLNVQDAQKLLDFVADAASINMTFAEQFAGEVSSNGSLTAYDAGLIFRKGSGFLQHFPVDINQSGFGPELSLFDPPPPLITAEGRTTPTIRLIPPENTSTDELGVMVELSGFDEPILSVELDMLITSQRMTFEMVGFTDSAFEELIFAKKANADELRVVWTSNESISDGIAGTLFFVPLMEGEAFISVTDARVNELDGPISLNGTSFIIEDNPAVSVNPPQETPGGIVLHQNYPNPFNPETVIGFDLPSATHATLTVHDLNGRLIQVLADRYYPSGTHHIRFNATNLASGMYIYRLVTDFGVETGKMMLVR